MVNTTAWIVPVIIAKSIKGVWKGSPTGLPIKLKAAIPRVTKAAIRASSPRIFPNSLRDRLSGFINSSKTCSGSIRGIKHTPITPLGLPAR
jgi:hypothetical protein